jgi:hypothetical protein
MTGVLKILLSPVFFVLFFFLGWMDAAPNWRFSLEKKADRRLRYGQLFDI